MATVLTHAIITNATQAVNTYVSSATSLSTQLGDLMTTLSSNYFQGEASDGYTVFYNTNVLPAITENLTGTNSLTAGIKSILEALQTQLLDTLDPQLGEYNQNPTSEG